MKVIKSIILADDYFNQVKEGDMIRIKTLVSEYTTTLNKICEYGVKINVLDKVKNIRYENIVELELIN